MNAYEKAIADREEFTRQIKALQAEHDSINIGFARNQALRDAGGWRVLEERACNLVRESLPSLKEIKYVDPAHIALVESALEQMAGDVAAAYALDAYEKAIRKGYNCGDYQNRSLILKGLIEARAIILSIVAPNVMFESDSGEYSPIKGYSCERALQELKDWYAEGRKEGPMCLDAFATILAWPEFYFRLELKHREIDAGKKRVAEDFEALRTAVMRDFISHGQSPTTEEKEFFGESKGIPELRKDWEDSESFKYKAEEALREYCKVSCCILKSEVA